MSALMAEKCNSLSHVVNIVYNCCVIIYCCTLICYLYTIVLTKVTRNKDIYIRKLTLYILSIKFSLSFSLGFLVVQTR